jgi:SpoVK/Ycf46/Vps4 family AAA+-type ATPase
MKSTLNFDSNTAGIAAYLKAFGNPRWSYLSRYCISDGIISWHGPVAEPPHEVMPNSNLLINPKLAGNLQFKEGQSYHVKISNLDAAEYVQLKEVSTSKEALPYVEGVEISRNAVLKNDAATWMVESCYPEIAYLSPETIVKTQANPQKSGPKNTPKLLPSSPTSKTDPFSRIIGHEEAKKRLKRIANKFNDPKKYMHLTSKKTRGVILHGPTGTEKMALVKAFNRTLNLNAISIMGTVDSPLLSKTFKDKKLKNGGIVFIEKIDGLSSEAARTLQQYMDGLVGFDHILTVATTSNLSAIPDELKRPGRFSEIIFVGRPSRSDRENLIDFHLEEHATDPGIDRAELAKQTQGFTEVDIELLINQAGDHAIDRLESGETDVVINQDDLNKALDTFQSTGARILNVRRPTITFDDIFGNEDEKEEIKTNLDLITGKKPSVYSNVKRQYILLHGPSGTGKTMRAEAMASHAGVLFKYMSSSDLEHKYVGESEQAWRKLFQDARNHAPCLLFIDEMDSLTRNRSNGHSHDKKVLNTILAELDGKASNDGLIVVGATNRLEDIDSAILDRFAFKYKIGLPDELDRADFLKKKFASFPAADMDYLKLAYMTEDWSFRKLANLADQIAMQLDGGKLHQITTNRITLLIDQIKRKATPTTIITNPNN